MEHKIDKFNRNFILVGLTLFMLFLIIDHFNPYLKAQDVKCLVIDKMLFEGRYRTYFYLILRDNKCRIFDMPVSPSTYNITQKGEEVIFNLREIDTQQEGWKNVFLLFIPIAILAAAIAFCCRMCSVFYRKIMTPLDDLESYFSSRKTRFKHVGLKLVDKQLEELQLKY